jgi:glutamate synthase domain-containing protein 2/glutamate synthase domain-containing protein 1/glutamate synthase domain-containing protein 3
MRVQPKPYALYDPALEHDACGIGAVVNISGRREHRVVELGKQVLLNLHHRGAAGSDEITGDGAGILLHIPHELLAEEMARQAVALPAGGAYGAGMVFSPQDQAVRRRCDDLLVAAMAHHGLKLLGWRQVPFDDSGLGDLAKQAQPVIRQVFLDAAGLPEDELERKLYLARKRAERLVREQLGQAANDFYVCSLSGRTMVYKGMFMAAQLFEYYPDLLDERTATALAIVHQRYSTNTFPNWRLAQPFRYLAHNGEINTLSGNRNRMRAREMNLASPAFAEHVEDLKPILTPDGSDSMCFDNALELLVQAGRSLPHAMMMLIPEAFGASYHISTDKRAFYEFHSAFQEPWDGPAAMVFTDGRLVGGTLDRNGLRPARYVVTADGLVVLGSEVGVIDLPIEKIQQKGRLQPGRMFLVDIAEQRIVTDNEIKSRIARQKPYRRWLEENRIELRGLFTPSQPRAEDRGALVGKMRAFGYTREELSMILTPMARDGQEPVGSMGNDAALAVLSDRPKLLFDYFKQLFAQVTNPPIDPLREGLVMSLMSYVGRERNLLDEGPEHCRMLRLPHPILANEDIDRLREETREEFRVATVQALFDSAGADAGEALRRGIEDLVERAAQAVRDGASLVILSDRGMSELLAPIPALLATSAVHHALLERRLRARAGIAVESGEPREVMHFCLLSGFGANAVNPYLAFEVVDELRRRGELGNEDAGNLADNYVAAVKKGLLKTMSKMGISTLRSYFAAQLFEAVGLGRKFIDAYMPGATSRIEGVGLAEIAEETLRRHRSAFTRDAGEAGVGASLDLEYGGEYAYRADGEEHLWTPRSVSRLQHAVQNADPRAYQDYADAINDQSAKLRTLRGLFELRPGECVPLEEVEPAASIVKRFVTGAMSHGSISREAHEALAAGMNRLGAMSNTGEGGEDPDRYRSNGGVSLNCAIKQVASGRFGVTIEYLSRARVLQVKMAQGAKPGEGGQLPGHKVTDEIARLRHSTPGVTLISPPPHHDIYSIEDLAQLIYDLKAANPGVEVSVKLVSEVGVGTVAAGVAKGNADEVLISGHDGGTGASPWSSIKHAGCPWELGLAETQQVLVLNGLRDRIRVQTDGQLRTGRDVVIAALLGADSFGFGTVALVTLGCVLVRKCHLGACPVGIATQDPLMRARFRGKPEYVERFMLFVAEDVRRHMAQLGFRTFDEMIGRVERLDTRKAVTHWKAHGLDFTSVFAQPRNPQCCDLRRSRGQVNRHADHLDWAILKAVASAIEHGTPVKLDLPIRNVHRAVGATLSNRIVKRWGSGGLPDGTIDITFRGSAGQSFGAFLAPGVTLRLVGDANDYVGKGLSGGRIVVQTPPEATFVPHENIVAGNVILYGATAGELFVNGVAGERFCVRNSGASAVVEGVGDHACEYMTGGLAVVLGATGRNFAAGMSGGIAYVLDEQQLFDTCCNLDMVDLEYVWHGEDREILHGAVRRHHEWTASPRARQVLDNWRQVVGRFVKVVPIDYRKSLERIRQREQRATEQTPATEEVFRG